MTDRGSGDNKAGNKSLTEDEDEKRPKRRHARPG